MSQSIRMERVQEMKSALPKLKQFEVAVTDTHGMEHVLKEIGFNSIELVKSLADGAGSEIYDIVAANQTTTIGLRRTATGWSFAGYGEASEVERLSRRFVDLLGAYHTMTALDAQGIGFQIQKTNDSVVIQIG